MTGKETSVNRLERIRRAKDRFVVCVLIDTPDAPWGTSFHMYLRWEVVVGLFDLFDVFDVFDDCVCCACDVSDVSAVSAVSDVFDDREL